MVNKPTMFDSSALYVAWNRLGANYNGRFDNVLFVNGVSVSPLSGDYAKRFQAMGFGIVKWEEGLTVKNWIQDGKHRRPVFAIDKNRVIEKIVEVEKIVKVESPNTQQATNGGGLPSLKGVKEIPTKLPDDYMKLFKLYTSSGGGLPSLKGVKEIPVELPEDYKKLFKLYTSSGKLKKAKVSNGG